MALILVVPRAMVRGSPGYVDAGPALRGAMQRSMPVISTRVAVIGGFLLLGLLAVAAWLLLSASPASAQTDDASTPPKPAPSDQSVAQESTPPAPSDSTTPRNNGEFRVPELPSLPIDLNALTPTLSSVTDVLPPALQPAVSDASRLLPPPVRAPIAPLLSRPAPPSPEVAVAPGASVQSGAPGPPPSDSGMTTTVSAPRGWPALHSQSTSELRAADSSSQEGGTRAPPSGLPSPVAAQGNAVSSSAGRDFGQSLLLFGVAAAGIIFLLGRGRRLLVEATGWPPAPWCFLIERPG
jgi:hypothetical protein